MELAIVTLALVIMYGDDQDGNFEVGIGTLVIFAILLISDPTITVLAEYSAENYRPNIRPKRMFGKSCRKLKKYDLVTFDL